MNYETIGGVDIYRPSRNAELTMRNDVESAMRTKLSSGTYRDLDTINNALKRYFSLYETKLKTLLPKIASQRLMLIILDQYDKSSAVEAKSKESKLNESDKILWLAIGPTYRRALKYLADCIVMLTPSETPTVEPFQCEEILEQCMICSEQLVEISILSTQTFSLFPNETKLIVHPKGRLVWFDLIVENAERLELFSRRFNKDIATRKEVIDGDYLLFNSERISRIIDPCFKSELGMTFSDIFEFFNEIIIKSNSCDEDFDIPFVNEQYFINRLHTEINLLPQESKLILDGLCIRESNMLKEGRVVWKPKQEYRAYTRPFFEFPHSTGTHFIWSRQMANECMGKLKSRLVQKQVPPEWNSNEIQKALSNYEQEITTEFENIVIQQLTNNAISASRFKSYIGTGANKVRIPNEIGEIDIIGFWKEENLLIVGDAKLVKPALEPAMYRDDIDKFIGKRKNYVDQIKRKTKWILENLQKITSALPSVNGFPDDIKINRVAPLIVTYYSSFASIFITDVPCVALSELISNIKEQQSWPYSSVHDVGIKN